MSASMILSNEAFIDEKVKNALARSSRVFAGTKKDVLDSGEPIVQDEKIVVMESKKWDDSKASFEVWNKFHEMRNKFDPKNTANAPTTAEIAALVGQFFIDVTRRAMENPDLTSRFATEITNLAFPKSVTLEDFLPYRGKFKPISGAQDRGGQIEQALGNTDTVALAVKALEWNTTLSNLLWNPIHNLQKVSQAVADAYVDERNAQTIGMIVGATFVASQQQAAITDAVNTDDVNRYETIKQAITLLRGLKDIQNYRPISTANGIKLLCNSADAWDLERVITGAMGSAAGVATAKNLFALPISEIITYDQGISNDFYCGKEQLDYPGVAAGKCYLFVPQSYLQVLTKRPLTMEMGSGNLFVYEERGWYFAGGTYSKAFLGSSYSGATCGAGYGAIVEVTLPSLDT